MLQISLAQFEAFLYQKLGLDKADYYRSLYNKASLFFDDKDFNDDNCLLFLSSIDNNISPYTYNNYLKALKKLGECLGVTFLKSYKLKKTKKVHVSVLEEEEMKKVIDVAYRADFRRGVATEVLLRAGLRINELTALEWKDVYDDHIFVEDPKTESREVAILPDLRTKIDELRGNHPTHVFATYKGRLHDQRYNQFLDKCLKQAGVDKHITAHKLRHSFSTYADEKGVSLPTLKNILGHTNIQTTEGYVHITQKRQREAMKKTALGQYKLSFTEAIAEVEKFNNSLNYDKKLVISDNEKMVITVYK